MEKPFYYQYFDPTECNADTDCPADRPFCTNRICHGKNLIDYLILHSCLKIGFSFRLPSLNTMFYIIKAAVNGTSYLAIIPKRPKSGCPTNTYGCSGDDCNNVENCFCEEHCSWKKCRLVNAPKNCLRDVKSNWSWDKKKRFWVAQIKGIIDHSNDLMII